MRIAPMLIISDIPLVRIARICSVIGDPLDE